MIHDFRDPIKLQKNVETESDLFAGKARCFDDTAAAGKVGPTEVVSLNDAKLQVVGGKEFPGGGEGNRAVACLGAGNDLFDAGEAVKPRGHESSDGSIGVRFGKNGDIPTRNHWRRLSKDGPR